VSKEEDALRKEAFWVGVNRLHRVYQASSPVVKRILLNQMGKVFMISVNYPCERSVCVFIFHPGDRQLLVVSMGSGSDCSSAAVVIQLEGGPSSPVCGWEDADDIHFDPEDFYEDSFRSLDDLEERLPADEYDDLEADEYDDLEDDDYDDEDDEDDIDF